VKFPTGGNAQPCEAREPASDGSVADPVRVRGRRLQSGWEKAVPRLLCGFFSLRSSPGALKGVAALVHDAHTDELYMSLAIDLSRRGEGTTSPNPVVGCVIVRDGAVVGTGFHERAGEPHAEIHALRAAGERARGATAYVTLEPCNHYGRTPPCTEALIAAGVARVVVAVADPDPNVAGAGIARLRTAGIEVLEGVLARQAALANRRYLVERAEKRPYVTLKVAASLDGRIADVRGDSQWITSEESREDAQELRRVHDAILVGAGTVRADNPRLTYRGLGPRARPLVRVVLAGSGSLPTSARVFSPDAPTIVFSTQPVTVPAEVVVVKGYDDHRIDVARVLDELHERGITSVLVEGGATTASAFLDAGFVDELVWYGAPTILGGDRGAYAGARLLSGALSFELHAIERIGPDFKVTAFREGMLERWDV
jgi:diaminohydroxyphosphoribosylaminopyrimidine deaminase/5-amino-6-(5-phosphoribosylamino)uracil reductase